MDIAHYATESDVYWETGITKETIKRVTEMEDKEITDMINGFLRSAEANVKDLLRIPFVVTRELHLGTGEDDEFDLGPEDEAFYIEELPANCVQNVLQCYFLYILRWRPFQPPMGGFPYTHLTRKKRPYPVNCDLCEDASEWDTGSDYVQPANEATIKMSGEYAMKFVFSSKLKARYPNVTGDNYLDKNIDPFTYIFFRVRCDTDNVKFVLRLYSMGGTSTAGGINTITFTDIFGTKTPYFPLKRKNHWYKVMLYIDDCFTGPVVWDNDWLSHFEIEVDQPCTIYFDNFNFNEDYCYTVPSGKLLIMHRASESPPEENSEFYVTYTYDPFTTAVPDNIKSATAEFAGVKLIDHLIGVRESLTGFEFQSDTLAVLPDKEILYNTRGTLLARAKENLANYGYGWSGTISR